MGTIVSKIRNCTETTTAIDATLSNNNTTFTVTGFPGQTKRLFKKQFTAIANHVFSSEPTVDFSDTSFPQNYTVTNVDTGSIAGGDLTVRETTVRYLFPYQPVDEDSEESIFFNTLGSANFPPSTGEIYSYGFDESDIGSDGGVKTLKVIGDAAATLTVTAKISGGADIELTTAVVQSNVSSSTSIPLQVSNSSIHVGMTVSGSGVADCTVVSITGASIVLSLAQTLTANTVLSFKGPFTATIGSDGVFSIPIPFPATSTNLTYNVVLTQIAAGSFVSPLLSPTTLVVKQYKPTIITFAITNNNPPASGSFTLSSNSFTDSGQANRNNSILLSYEPTEILFTASTSASGYSIILGAQEFTTQRWSSLTAAPGKYITLAGGTSVAFSEFSIVIDNSQSTKIATVRCLATVLFHGSSDQTTNLNINDILTTQQ
jgi:hypothetical protein